MLITLEKVVLHIFFHLKVKINDIFQNVDDGHLGCMRQRDF